MVAQKRFTLCYRVCPVLCVMLVYSGQTVGCIKMPLGTEVGLGPGYIVLDGDRAPSHHSSPPPTFQPMSIEAKRSPISATAELLLKIIRLISIHQSPVTGYWVHTVKICHSIRHHVIYVNCILTKFGYLDIASVHWHSDLTCLPLFDYILCLLTLWPFWSDFWPFWFVAILVIAVLVYGHFGCHPVFTSTI